MNIEQLKQIEDLRSELGQLNEQLSAAYLTRKSNFINGVRSDFERFFTEKGFTVSSGARVINASYGSLGAILAYDDPKSDFIGSIFSFNLALKLQDVTKYFILLNPDNSKSSFKISFDNSTQNTNFEDEINKISENIEATKQQLENPESEVWSLFVRDETLPTSPKEYWKETFPNLYELLSKLVQ